MNRRKIKKQLIKLNRKSTVLAMLILAYLAIVLAAPGVSVSTALHFTGVRIASVILSAALTSCWITKRFIYELQ